MPGSVDSSGALDKIARLKKATQIGAGIASRQGAETVAEELRRKVPVRTGRLRGAVSTKVRDNSWFATIRRRSFPAFFYAIMFTRIYRKVANRMRGRVKAQANATLKSFIRSRV